MSNTNFSDLLTQLRNAVISQINDDKKPGKQETKKQETLFNINFDKIDKDDPYSGMISISKKPEETVVSDSKVAPSATTEAPKPTVESDTKSIKLDQNGKPLSGFDGDMYYENGVPFTGELMGQQYKDGIAVRINPPSDPTPEPTIEKPKPIIPEGEIGSMSYLKEAIEKGEIGYVKDSDIEYDEQGRITTFYSEHNRVTNSIPPSRWNLYQKFSIEYKEDGSILIKEERISSTNSIIEDYKSSENWNLSAEREITSDGSKTVKKYDENGNVTSVETYDKDGNKISEDIPNPTPEPTPHPPVPAGERGSIEFLENITGEKFENIKNAKYDENGMLISFEANGLNYQAWWPNDDLSLDSSYYDSKTGLTVSTGLWFEGNKLSSTTYTKYNGQNTIEVESYDANGNFAFSVISNNSEKYPCLSGYSPGYTAVIAFNNVDECEKYIIRNVNYGDKAVINEDGTVEITKANGSIVKYDKDGNLLNGLGSKEYFAELLGIDFDSKLVQNVQYDDQGRINTVELAYPIPMRGAFNQTLANEIYTINYDEWGSFNVTDDKKYVSDYYVVTKDPITSDITTSFYDADGKLYSSTQVVEKDKFKETTDKHYDNEGNVTYQYYLYDKFDDKGNVIESGNTSTYSDGSTFSRMSNYTYDANNNLVRDEGNEKENGEIVRTFVAQYKYDDANRKIDHEYVVKDLEGNIVHSEKLTNEYYDNGNLKKATSEYGSGDYSNKWSDLYDENGNLIESESSYTSGDYSSGSSYKYTYDSDNRLTHREGKYTENGKVTETYSEDRKYNAAGNLTYREYTSKDAEGNITYTSVEKNEYYDNGNLKKSSYESKGQDYKYLNQEEYYENGSLKSSYYFDSWADGSMSKGMTTYYEDGIIKSSSSVQRDADGMTTREVTSKYDEKGNLISTDGKQIVKADSGNYINLNGIRLWLYNPSGENVEVTYTIDGNGQMVLNANGLDISAAYPIIKYNPRIDFNIEDDSKNYTVYNEVAENTSTTNSISNFDSIKIPSGYWGKPLENLTINGNNNNITGTAGDDKITVNGDNNKVDLGEGEDSLKINGSNNKVKNVEDIDMNSSTPQIKPGDVGSKEWLSKLLGFNIDNAIKKLYTLETDEKGRIIKVKDNFSKSNIEYAITYNEYGTEIETIDAYDCYEKYVRSFDSEGTMYNILTEAANKIGGKTVTNTNYNPDGTISVKSVQNYNEKGIMTGDTHTVYNADGSVCYERIASEFDENGNAGKDVITGYKDNGNVTYIVEDYFLGNENPYVWGWGRDDATLTFVGGKQITVQSGERAVVNADGTVNITKVNGKVEKYDINGNAIKVKKTEIGTAEYVIDIFNKYNNINATSAENKTLNEDSMQDKEYDDLGRLISFKTSILVQIGPNIRGVKKEPTNFEIKYNDDGSYSITSSNSHRYWDTPASRLTKVHTLNTEIISDFDKDGNLVSVNKTEIRDGEKTVTKYDADGKVISTVKYDEDGNEIPL